MIRFDHLDRCSGEDFKDTLRPNGDVKRRCRGCNAFLVLYADKIRKSSRLPDVRSRWRCREHPDQAVTPKGTGCPLCAQGVAS